MGSLRSPLTPTHVSAILQTFGCQQLSRLDLFDVGNDPPPSRTLSQIASTFPTLESLTLLSDEHLGSWPGSLVSNIPPISDPGGVEWIAQRGETDPIFARQHDCVQSLQSLSSLRYLCWNNVDRWEHKGDLDALEANERDDWLFGTVDPLAVPLSTLQEIKFAGTWIRFCKSCIITRMPIPSTKIVESSLDFLSPDWLVKQDI
jgi:hypothetical protein